MPMIAIGWSFLKASTAPRANMLSESQKPAPENTAVCNPFVKKTVIPTDRNAASIKKKVRRKDRSFIRFFIQSL